MQKRRMALFVTLLLITLMVLTACGPRVGGGERAAAAGPNDLVVDLPAIYIDFDANGVASIGGRSISEAAGMVGQSIPDVTIDAATITTLADYGIQHLQLINSPSGLDILVNGLRVPSLGWNGEVLTNLKDVLSMLGVDLGSAGNLLPLLGTFGTGIVLRFPVPAGAEAVPMMNPVGDENAMRAAESAAAYSASVGEAGYSIQFAVNYAADGTWTVDNRGAAEWAQVLPFEWEQFNSTPEKVAEAVAAGLKNLGVSTSPEGVNLSINDKALPTITWGSGELSNLLTLLQESGLISSFTGDNPQIAGMVDLVEGLLPAVQSSNVSMVVNFPAP